MCQCRLHPALVDALVKGSRLGCRCNTHTLAAPTSLSLQKEFLETYSNPERVHEKVIDDMCAASGTSLNISYLHLSHHSPILAIWLADVPKQMLELFDEVRARSERRAHSEQQVALQFTHRSRSYLLAL